MTASLEVPTATSVRAVPAKLMADNLVVINNFLKRIRGGKISFTHLIGYAVVRAVADFPNTNRSFTVVDGRPAVTTPANVDLGLAIDLPGKGGTRNLVVVTLHGAAGAVPAELGQLQGSSTTPCPAKAAAPWPARDATQRPLQHGRSLQ